MTLISSLIIESSIQEIVKEVLRLKRLSGVYLQNKGDYIYEVLNTGAIIGKQRLGAKNSSRLIELY